MAFALLDMDSFYAQVESKRLGLSNDVPLGVQQHEHFIAVNYAARKRGVPSRCAVDRAKQICPEVIAAEVEMIHDVKPSLERYRRASEQVLNILLEFFEEDEIEKASIDEAYLDLRGLGAKAAPDNRTVLQPYEKAIYTSDEVALEPADERQILLKASNVMNQVRQTILERLGFTSSCGIAHNKLVAKIAASKNKPAGQTIVFTSGIKPMMRTTGLRKIKGLGGKLGRRLEHLHKQIVAKKEHNDDAEENVLGAIQSGELSFAALEKEFGTKTARYITTKANGEDDSEIVSKLKPKTLLSIKTFYQSLTFIQVQDWLRLEANELAKRMIQDHELFQRLPRTLVLHFHRNDGENVSRRAPFHANEVSNVETLAEDIYRAGDALLRHVDAVKEGSRGIGIAFENFSESAIFGNSLASIPRITQFFSKSEKTSESASRTLSPVVDSEGAAWMDEDDDGDELLHEEEGDEEDDEEQLRMASDDDEAKSEGETDEYGQIFNDPPTGTQQNLSAAAKLAMALTRPQTSSEAGASAFVSRFFRASRLSFIGSWKRRFESLLDSIPEPPPLKPPKFGERVIIHVDMDAFFCTASLLKRPDLVDKPVAVCWSNATSESSTTSAAEISSCNYIARSRGVRASMSLARAKLLCPELTCIPFDFDLYENIGMIFYQILFDITPHVEGVSCDEAYLDVTHLVQDKADVKKIADKVRATIYEKTKGVTASAGAGKNRLIARLSTAKAKPNGSMSFSFAPDEEIFIQLLNDEVEVGNLPSIGWSTCDKLKRELDVNTVKELRAVPLGRLKYFFGPKSGENMYNLCRGIDTRPWNPRPVRDSVSVQISWGVRMQNLKEVHDFLGELARECYRRLGTREGDSVNLKIWRAVENQPDHHRKGQIGHGVCDILTRSKSQIIRGGGQATTSSSSSAALIAPEERALLDSAIEIFTDLRVRPEDVRGLGLFITGLAKPATIASKKRRVATNVPSPSKWVEGYGVVPSKRYRASGRTSTSAKGVDESLEAVLTSTVAEGDDACFRLVEKELVYAFEEARCIKWPNCESEAGCSCLQENCNALGECAKIIIALMKRGASKHLLLFARWKARTRYGVLPETHPITKMTAAGGGLLFFNERLDDLCELEGIDLAEPCT